MVREDGTPAAGAPHTRTLFTVRRAHEIAPLLEELAGRAPRVTIHVPAKGDDDSVLLAIVLSSPDEAGLEAAAGWLAERLPGQPAV
jgi:hypothetical protein